MTKVQRMTMLVATLAVFIIGAYALHGAAALAAGLGAGVTVLGMAAEDNSDIGRQLRAWGLVDYNYNLKSRAGTGGMFGNVITLLDAQISLAGVGNGADATDDTLFTKAILGNTLKDTASALRVTLNGVTAANGQNKRVKIIYGASTVVDSGVITSNAKNWTAQVLISRTAAATQVAIGSFTVDGVAAVVTKTAPTETLSGNVTVKGTGSSPTSSSASDILGHSWTVELLPVVATA